MNFTGLINCYVFVKSGSNSNIRKIYGHLDDNSLAPLFDIQMYYVKSLFIIQNVSQLVAIKPHWMIFRNSIRYSKYISWQFDWLYALKLLLTLSNHRDCPSPAWSVHKLAFRSSIDMHVIFVIKSLYLAANNSFLFPLLFPALWIFQESWVIKLCVQSLIIWVWLFLSQFKTQDWFNGNMH